MTTTPDYAGLLPCPHCGGIAAKHHRPQAGAVRIVCSECAAQTGWFSEAHGGSPDVAWNRRAPSDADNYIDQLNTLCEDFGCEPGSDRLHWLHERLSERSTLLESNAALERYAREATIAITGLTAGGSEYSGKRIGEMYTADLPFCVERIRERMGYRMEQLRAEAERDRLKERVAELEKALTEAEDGFEAIRLILIKHLDEPERQAFWRAVQCRNSIRTARSLVKGGGDE